MLAALVADGIAKQKLHVIMIVDTSRSMQGERIGQVNSAIADIHKYLIDLQGENSNVDFYMSIMTFANKAEFVSGYKAINVEDMTPPRLKAIGYSNLHCAYEELSTVLHKESKGGMMPDFGGIAPIILLLTDGHPTKATESQLAELKKLPWFRVSLRYGIAIELNDARTMRVLTDFTEDKDCVVECIDAATLAKIIQVIVVTASKVKSQSNSVGTNRSSKGGRGIVNQNNAHIVVKQQVKTTLDEIDDWEWEHGE
jgi:uncharacterized protein YegL